MYVWILKSCYFIFSCHACVLIWAKLPAVINWLNERRKNYDADVLRSDVCDVRCGVVLAVEDGMARCPLCAGDIVSSEQSWRTHLMSLGVNGCPKNARVHRQQQQLAKKGVDYSLAGWFHQEPAAWTSLKFDHYICRWPGTRFSKNLNDEFTIINSLC